MDYQAVWFVLICVLITGYVVLDGFDLGVGVLHLFARNESERRVHMQSIGPVWDGNEVWLITAGGALFAAFPPVYATVASAFYLALLLLLLALIARAVSLEVRGKLVSPAWRRVWDLLFGVGSLVVALLLGVALGNLLCGVPLAADGSFQGSFVGLLNPYALLAGVTGLVLLTLHGAAYLLVKSTGELNERMRQWIPRLWTAFLVLFSLLTLCSLVAFQHLFAAVHTVLFWVLLVALAGAVFCIPRACRAGKEGQTFLGTTLTIVLALGLAAVNVFPTFLYSTIDKGFSLTARNASSSEYTLKIMFNIAALGMPLVLVYTFFVYRVFRGKIEVAEDY